MFRRVLVDTDVILDLLLGRRPFYPSASRLFVAFQEGHIEGHVSSLAFSNLFYLLRKEEGGGPGAIAILRKLRLVTRVLMVDEKIIDLALASTFTDFEDAIQYFAAAEWELDAIVTRNRRDYKASKIAIVSAEECLELAGL
ncbi:MAG TPA: PIN domain-containing protein [Thermoanaerobaculia bacterium]|nr:PIN domain-containing protein [Thermoanaerobaculia bacterium]